MIYSFIFFLLGFFPVYVYVVHSSGGFGFEFLILLGLALCSWGVAFSIATEVIGNYFPHRPLWRRLNAVGFVIMFLGIGISVYGGSLKP